MDKIIERGVEPFESEREEEIYREGGRSHVGVC